MADRKEVHCPECNHGDGVRKVKDEDFYRCSGCKNEWFSSEMIRIPFKTIKFEGQDGRIKYLPLTQKTLVDWKERSAGFYSKPFQERKFKKGENGKNYKSIGRAKKGWRGKRDDELLRRLKKK